MAMCLQSCCVFFVAGHCVVLMMRIAGDVSHDGELRLLTVVPVILVTQASSNNFLDHVIINTVHQCSSQDSSLLYYITFFIIFRTSWCSGGEYNKTILLQHINIINTSAS